VDDLTGLVIDRDAEWEGAWTEAEKRPNALLGLISDANRCAAESARR